MIALGNFNQEPIVEFTVCLWLQLLEPDNFEILAIDFNLTLGRNITLQTFEKIRYAHSISSFSVSYTIRHRQVHISIFTPENPAKCECASSGKPIPPGNIRHSITSPLIAPVKSHFSHILAKPGLERGGGSENDFL